MEYEKIKEAIRKALLTTRNLHNLKDEEIEGLSKLISSVALFNEPMRQVFYKGIAKIDEDIKKESRRQEKEILDKFPEEERKRIRFEAEKEAREKLNKKGVVN